VDARDTSFAARLKALREVAGLSQYALANRSGLSKQALSQLELGRREPTWATVQLLAAALGVSCEKFNDPALRPPEPPAEPPRRGRPRKAMAENQSAEEPPASESGAGKGKGKPRKRKEG
jgi:transcriptional regulator with XRE-family HTH domain